MNSPILRLDGVAKGYHDGQRELEVLKKISLELYPAETIAILGRSGTGKTTLLNLLGLLDRPAAGTIVIKDIDVSKMSESGRTSLRGKLIGFVFQHYHLLPDLNALENVEIAGHVAGCPDRDRAESLLDAVGLKDRLRHKPRQLSGGEQQRVAIARALMPKPSLLLCDEPTGNLDPATGEEVMNLLCSVVRANNTSMILVTHDDRVATRADRVLKLEYGKLHVCEKA